MRQAMTYQGSPLPSDVRAGREAERLHSARLLWSSVCGICALGGKLNQSENMTSLVVTLIEHSVAGIRADNAAQA